MPNKSAVSASTTAVLFEIRALLRRRPMQLRLIALHFVAAELSQTEVCLHCVAG
jgi:hypothetical protein